MGSRKDETDYHNMGETLGLLWVAEKLPKNTAYATEWECSVCGTVKSKEYTHLQQGYGCANCAGCARLTEEDYHLVAHKRGGQFLGPLPDNNATKTYWLCPSGHEIFWSYTAYRRGNCYKCYRKDADDYREVARKNGITWIGKTIPNNVLLKTTWQCAKDHIWDSAYDTIRSGWCCGACNESKGEKELARVLDYFLLTYQREKSFDTCRSINPLPFDFYIPEFNCLIEFDGIQHYEDLGWGTTETTKKHDIIKNEWAEANDYKLLRIPYWELENIEAIIALQLL